MAPRTVYANLPDGLANLNLWDQSLADMGSLGMIPCTAAGTNAIVLTPIASAFPPNVTNPPNPNQMFSFVAAATSTGAVTVQIAGVTNFLQLYRMDAATQAGSGDVQINVTYVVSFGSALNSNAGGFQIQSPASISSSYLNFIAAGTGAVIRTVQAKERDFINVKDFGAAGDGSTDDTTALQNAVTAAVAAGAELDISPGNYKISAQINVNGALTIRGANSATTIITLSNLAASGFVITTANAVKIFNLTIQSASQQTAGAMIQLTASGAENQFSVFRDLVLLNAFIGLDIVAATEYAIDNCYVNATSIGIHIQNTFNADHGDPKITNNTILQNNTGGGSMGVKWESGGGIKFIGNKINGYAFGFVASQAATGSTTIMLLEGNSIENQGTAAIVFQIASGTPTLNHVVITGNHIAGTPIGIEFPTTTGTWPKNLVITDNVILLSAAGTFGVQVLGGTNVVIGHNAILGGGGTPTGILIGAGVVSGQIGIGAYSGLTTNITNNSAGMGVLTLGAGKTFTVSNTLALAGTDGTTMTFPGASDTVVTLGATQTLTGKTLTSPILTTPAIGAATGTSLALTGGGITFATSGQGHVGTTTNDNANAGIVGEVISSTIASGSAVSLVSGTTKTVTSITLTAGDWDVSGNVYYSTGGTTTVTSSQVGISTTTNAFPATPDGTQGYVQWFVPGASAVTGSTPSLATGTFRQSVSTSTTIFLVCQSNFGTSTNAAYGTIRARRMR